MKARVKATGEIVEARRICQSSQGPIWEAEGSDYYEYELDFDVQEPTKYQYNPDYWTRLEHQYAGMVMQGILSNPEYLRSLMHTKHDDYRVHEVVPNVAVRLSHALVEKLKEKEEK
jgi:hypothetical protein